MRQPAFIALAALLALGTLADAPSTAIAGPSTRPYLDAAKVSFGSRPMADRMAIQMLLIATGDFNAMMSDRLGGRLYDAVVQFQRAQGLSPSGIVTDETLARLRAVVGPIIAPWQLRFVDHPLVPMSVYVPFGFGLVQQTTRRGLAFENSAGNMALDFSFFPDAEASMADVFTRLSTAGPSRRINMKMMKADFFAIAGGSDTTGFYARYVPIEGGTVGFTMAWSTNDYPQGYRVAVLVANGLLPAGPTENVTVAKLPPPAPAYVPPVATPTYTAPVPASVPPSPPPSPPAQQASLETPKATAKEPSISTGSAFYVSTDGVLVTNNHVLRGCTSAIVLGKGEAEIATTDERNDLALLRLKAKPTDAAGIKAVSFRTTTMQLGETVYALGFPLAGKLDNGLNFTSGMVSSLSGLQNDSTEFQMTAPIQPGNSGGPLLDSAGSLIGVTVAKLDDLVALKDTGSLPQNVNFGIKGEIVGTFLRANGITPQMAGGAAVPLTAPEVAALGKAQTAQVMCMIVDTAGRY